MTLSNRLQELTPEFTAIRRDFHRHPELGHCEWETSRKICRYLTDWGYEVHDNIASTGVVARLKKGSSKKCICIRADMDALPIAEANHFAHASAVDQVMHACGHDGHMTMALMAPNTLTVPCNLFSNLVKSKTVEQVTWLTTDFLSVSPPIA